MRPSRYAVVWVAVIVAAAALAQTRQAVITVAVVLTVLLVVGAVRGNPSSIKSKRRHRR